MARGVAPGFDLIVGNHLELFFFLFFLVGGGGWASLPFFAHGWADGWKLSIGRFLN